MKINYYKNIIRHKNNEIQKWKEDLAKRAREIHLPYTYKKRFNQIVKENACEPNYPRARTSAKQEVTIGNVLDYLNRVVKEKQSILANHPVKGKVLFLVASP